MVVDRLGLSVLRDPFSNNPYITFHATRRVGGGVVDFDAIKFLKFSA
jgi:HK97 family phage major capsid protein